MIKNKEINDNDKTHGKSGWQRPERERAWRMRQLVMMQRWMHTVWLGSSKVQLNTCGSDDDSF